MYKLRLIALLVAACLAQDSPREFYLTPPLPPTTFQGQYYTVQFRVTGMDNPTFSFDNIPQGLTARSDGTIEGTPQTVGSFAVRVNFQSGSDFGSKDIVIRVVSPLNPSDPPTQTQQQKQKARFMVVSKNSSLTFWTGDHVELILEAMNGQEPYTWNYINLPSQLAATPLGTVSGIFDLEGYYTFSASACDSLGLTADSFFTLNIQPSASAKRFPLLEVPNRVFIRYDLQQVYDQQIAATNALFQSLNARNTAQNQTDEARNIFNQTNVLLQIANIKVNASDQRCKTALATKNGAELNLSNSEAKLSNSRNYAELSATRLQNAKDVVQSAEQTVSAAERTAAELQSAFSTASKEFITAQTDSSLAAEVVKLAITGDITSRNDYTLAFTTLSNRKQALQGAQNSTLLAQTLVSSAQNTVDLIRQLNDNAEADLTEAQGVYQLTKAGLDHANEAVAVLQGNLTEAANELGAAEFNLHQAMSALYVAQARKEQADKATEIVRFQTWSAATTRMFAGCEPGAYPSIMGSATVLRASGNGLQLSTGSLLLYGDCSEVESGVRRGDLINYSGYLKQGFVQCMYFKRIQ